MRRPSSSFVRAGVSAVLVLASLPGVAFAGARLADPPARNTPAGNENTTDCNGTGTMNVKTLPEGATAMQVRITDVDNFGCFQVAIFDGTSRLGNIVQQVDNNATSRDVTFADVPIPGSCRNGKTCTVHTRQLLVADAGACPADTASLGTGALGNRYSCGDFRVAQPAAPDASRPDSATPTDPDSGAPPGPTAPPFNPLPEPVGEAGTVQVSGLSPSDAQSEGCSVSTLGAHGTVFGTAGALGLAVAGAAIVARRRRSK